MSITLERQYTIAERNGATVLTEAPMFGRTKKMSRWHVPRTGTVYANGRISYGVWCSASYLTVGDALLTDVPDDSVPVCGTCVGRAQGAGHALPVVEVTHAAGIVFEPRFVRRPRTCPGAKRSSWHAVNHRVGRCIVCGEYMPIRAKGGPYDGFTALVAHAPGAGLVDPCPLHAWDRITADGICSCGHPPVPLATTSEANR
ncbi:hypothetical protein KZC52_16870 [Microbacterium sp. kSW2-24]|uniref:hypothetical protein n=1 Tax=Microbacterium galbinum TaxID=2851646 RepID=UPI001FFDDF9A|nr:hypothetical protein [Microbacterium galbinum]MCK2024603.1 hypothetical protein [Microbacterium galbinum]